MTASWKLSILDDDDDDNCYKKSHSQKPLIGEKRIPRAVANDRFMIVAGMVSKKKLLEFS